VSVRKRIQANGKLTPVYHYRFMVGGKLYTGACMGCTDEKSALVYERQIYKTAIQLSQQKSVKAIVENFQTELAGATSKKITLESAWEFYLKKPRRFTASEYFVGIKKSQFDDFVLYMQEKHPDVKYVMGITRSHAEEYIAYLRENGKYNKTVVFSNRTKKSGSKLSEYKNPFGELSATTVNRYHKTIREVLKVIGNEAGLIENPFIGVPLQKEDKGTREAFTQSEIESIIKIAPEFVRAIFIVGFFTALREGDIATLRWSDIIWEHGIIRRKLLKTKNIVEIPIMQPLKVFLEAQIGKDEEYVLPEHAAMYRDNPSGITYRVKDFLESIEIQTSRAMAGRTRKVSVKGIHSLRHTFCYLAGVAGIPLVIVQSIVGHMTPEMTSYYSAHADRGTKRKKMELLNTILGGFKGIESGEVLEIITPQIESSENTEGRLGNLRKEVAQKILKADEKTLDRVRQILQESE